VTAVVVSPHARLRRAAGVLATAICVAGGAVFAWSAVSAATTDFGETLARYPRERIAMNSLVDGDPRDLLVAEVPVLLIDRDHLLWLALTRGSRGPDQVRGELLAGIGFDTAEPARHPVVPMPAGWTGEELVGSIDLELGTTQRFRVVFFHRPLGDQWAMGVLTIPEVLARDAAGQLTRIIASVQPMRPAPAGSVRP